MKKINRKDSDEEEEDEASEAEEAWYGMRGT